MKLSPETLTSLESVQLDLEKAIGQMEADRDNPDAILGWVREARALNDRFGEMLSEIMTDTLGDLLKK